MKLDAKKVIIIIKKKESKKSTKFVAVTTRPHQLSHRDRSHKSAHLRGKLT